MKVRVIGIYDQLQVTVLDMRVVDAPAINITNCVQTPQDFVQSMFGTDMH